MNIAEIEVIHPSVSKVILENCCEDDQQHEITCIAEDDAGNTLFSTYSAYTDDTRFIIDSVGEPIIYDACDEHEAYMCFTKDAWKASALLALNHRDALPLWSRTETELCKSAIYYAVFRIDGYDKEVGRLLTDSAESFDEDSNYSENSFGDKVFRGSDISVSLLFDDGSLFHSDAGGSESWSDSSDFEAEYHCELKDGRVIFNQEDASHSLS